MKSMYSVYQVVAPEKIIIKEANNKNEKDS